MIERVEVTTFNTYIVTYCFGLRDFLNTEHRIRKFVTLWKFQTHDKLDKLTN